MNVYLVRLLLVIFMASSSIPAQAGWLADMGSSLSSTVSGWFSSSSDQSKKTFAVVASVIAVGLSAYLIYALWKKNRGGNDPVDPGNRPDNPPQPPMPIIPVCPPIIVIEPVERAPQAVPIPAPQVVSAVPPVAAVAIPLGKVVPSAQSQIDEKNKREPEERARKEKEQEERIKEKIAAEARDKEIQHGVQGALNAIIDRVEQTEIERLVQEIKERKEKVAALPPQAYLSWHDQEIKEREEKERKAKQQPTTPVVVVPEPAHLQVEDKVNADLAHSTEWDHVSHTDVLPESPKDLVQAHKDLVERGREISQKVIDGQKTELVLDEVRALMWHIWSPVPSNISELTFKVEDTPDRRLYKALLTCTDEKGTRVYDRGSSHFPGQVEGGKHYGINIEGLPLPEKTTILFAPLIKTDELRIHLGENTIFYIKPEDHPCENPLSVLWEEGIFRGLSSTASMALHGYQFAHSNVGALLYPDWHDRREYYAKERTPYVLSQAFLACLEHVDDDAQKLKEYTEFAHLKKGSVAQMNHAIGALKAKLGEEDRLAEKMKAFTLALDQEYSGEQLKNVGVINGREIFHKLEKRNKRKSRAVLVDLEAEVEINQKRDALSSFIRIPNTLVATLD